MTPAVHPFAIDDRAALIEEAARFRDMGPEARMAVFRDILDLVSAAWAHLPEEERLRRLRIGDMIDPRPDPWWKNVRPEALP